MLGYALEARRQLPEALAAYRAALTTDEELIRLHPEEERWHANAAHCHLCAALVQLQLGDADAARPSGEAAIEILDGQLSENPGHTGLLADLAHTYADLGSLLHTYVRLRDREIVPYWCINHGPTTSLYYRDPDGNQVELQIDNFETPEALEAWFLSGAFQENPIGVTFDPEKLLSRFENGDPIEDLVLQGSA